MSVIGQSILAGGGGTSSSEVTASKAQVLAGYTTITTDSNDEIVEGTIPSKAAATYTPTTSNQTIAAGQYLSGAQTIAGESNLVASNILYGKSIFGISGNVRKYASTNGSWSYSGSRTYTGNKPGGATSFSLPYHTVSPGFTPMVYSSQTWPSNIYASCGDRTYGGFCFYNTSLNNVCIVKSNSIFSGNTAYIPHYTSGTFPTYVGGYY